MRGAKAAAEERRDAASMVKAIIVKRGITNERSEMLTSVQSEKGGLKKDIDMW